MKILSMAVMAIAAAMAVQAGQGPQTLAVYVRHHGAIDFQALYAEELAKKMFAAIGVGIEWRAGKPAPGNPTGAVAIELVDQTRSNFMPGVLAYALPYEGTHIIVFHDRIAARHPNAFPQLLAHVMVHEIAHILEGISRHSDSGIMKATWSADDYTEMRFSPIAFAPEDIFLIKSGMEARGNRAAATAADARRR